MSPAMDQWFILECFHPFGNMADFTVFFGHVADNICWVRCPDMFGSRPVAHLTPGILQVGGFFKADKSSRFAVTGGMAWITFINLLGCKVLHLLFNALK